MAQPPERRSNLLGVGKRESFGSREVHGIH